ncbi:MAG: transcription antitermination factor NusB [Corynebacterium sp.]|uniref:transcription antitermination factor NusB n=1 Tax=Corynebacterium sp. TaxID=1720 RepID=UPI0026DB044C|nr:transcription antitermination factor NusB [Corynebacterium sp.]MDO4760347.1 transcription antitermination factor NusB [Corynebacterium sp.]
MTPSSKDSSDNERRWKRHGSRYKARRRAVEILYEAEARDVDPVAIVQDRISLALHQESNVAPVAHYTREIVSGVAEELNRIDEIIASYLSKDWELHRIAAVDRAILRACVWEMIFNEDVPVLTAVTEAIELASQYSADRAPAYINGVLDAAVKNIDALKSPVDADVAEVDVQSDDGVETEHDAEISGASFAEALAEAEDLVEATDDESVSDSDDASDVDQNVVDTAGSEAVEPDADVVQSDESVGQDSVEEVDAHDAVTGSASADEDSQESHS